ncbi:MAG: nucleoside-diphosphate-sugar epimerase [Paraglaciecola sp.]|jgi:nucleoside-diphosphate-sugar epimerase
MKIGVYGCGWLGLPLALKLKSAGHSIVATRRSEEAVRELLTLGFAAIPFTLGDTLSSERLQPLFASELIILNIPPGRKSIQAHIFAAHMTDLVEAIAIKSNAKLIFISTSSVYGNTSGNITEQTPVSPTSDSGKAHVLIEQAIFEQFENRACVIRLTGLVGKNRHPAKHLAGRTGIPNGQHAVNLVHQLDVINAIQQIINHNVWGQTLHLCSTEHPSREDYYRWAATKLGLPTPEFIAEKNAENGKQIDARSSIEKLGLNLQYPSPFDMLS